MLRLFALVLLAWLLLLPPFFTDGACTAEFDMQASRLQADRAAFTSPSLASAYWSARQVPHTVLSPQQCKQARPRYVEFCSAGAVVYATVPVRNKVCRFYRDDEIRIQLQYDAKDRLARMQTDMHPYKSLPLPFVGRTLHWGR